jgi:hypothetical protein
MNSKYVKACFAFYCFLGVFILNGCFHTPQKIERYIKRHCDFKTTDTCFVDLRKVLKTDYDTMYVFNSFTPLTCVQNILGIKDYGKSKNPETTFIGYDSDMCRIILIKNYKVVYEDEYHYNDYNTKLVYRDFPIVEGEGIFDVGPPVRDHGYICTDYIFKVTKRDNKYYRVEIP